MISINNLSTRAVFLINLTIQDLIWLKHRISTLLKIPNINNSTLNPIIVNNLNRLLSHRTSSLLWRSSKLILNRNIIRRNRRISIINQSINHNILRKLIHSTFLIMMNNYSRRNHLIIINNINITINKSSTSINRFANQSIRPRNISSSLRSIHLANRASLNFILSNRTICKRYLSRRTLNIMMNSNRTRNLLINNRNILRTCLSRNRNLSSRILRQPIPLRSLNLSNLIRTSTKTNSNLTISIRHILSTINRKPSSLKRCHTILLILNQIHTPTNLLIIIRYNNLIASINATRISRNRSKLVLITQNIIRNSTRRILIALFTASNNILSQTAILQRNLIHRSLNIMMNRKRNFNLLIIIRNLRRSQTIHTSSIIRQYKLTISILL